MMNIISVKLKGSFSQHGMTTKATDFIVISS